MKDIFDFYISPIVTWGLVILGWLHISKQNNKTETRKEIRNAINHISKEILNLNEVCISYLCEVSNTDKSKAAIKKEIEIKRSFDIIELKLKSISSIDEEFKDAENLLSKYNDKITGHIKFENRGYNVVLPEDHKDIYELSLALKEFLEFLENKFKESQIKK